MMWIGLCMVAGSLFLLACVTLWLLRRIAEDVDETLARLDTVLWITRHSAHLERRQTMLLDELLAEVAEIPTILESLDALLDGLAAKLDAAIADGDPVKIQTAIDEIKADKARIIASIVAHTPAEPAPPA